MQRLARITLNGRMPLFTPPVKSFPAASEKAAAMVVSMRIGAADVGDFGPGDLRDLAGDRRMKLDAND